MRWLGLEVSLFSAFTDKINLKVQTILESRNIYRTAFQLLPRFAAQSELVEYLTLALNTWYSSEIEIYF